MEIIITVNGQSTTLKSENSCSLIGRKYIPRNNSYSNCLSVPSYYSGKKEYYLAGNMVGDKPKVCTIVSEPFHMLITGFNKSSHVENMVLIKCPNGLTHCYMYHKSGLLN